MRPLAGLLAHEAAHLHHKDRTFELALIGMNGITTAQQIWGSVWMVIALGLLVATFAKGMLLTWVTPLILVA